MDEGLKLPQGSTSASTEDVDSMITLFSSKAAELLQNTQSQILEVKELRDEMKDLENRAEVQDLKLKIISYKIDAHNA
jgi:phage shock protein A